MAAEYEDALASIRRRLKEYGARVQQVNEAGKRAVHFEADEQTICSFRGMSNMLEKSFYKFDDVWNELCDLKNPSAGGDRTPSQHDKDIRASVDRYYCSANAYLERLNMQQAADHSRRIADAESARRSTLPADITLSASRVSRGLPKIQLPSFEGDLLAWSKFRDTYISLIHNDDAMSPIDKFHYLRTSLNGRALSVISHIQLTANNYDTAWQAVEKAFNNPRLLASTHIDHIINFKPLQGRATAETLQKFLSGVGDSIAAFKNLKIEDESSFLLFYLAVRGLDNHSRELFEMENKNVTYPTYDALMKFVRERCVALQLTNHSIFQVSSASSNSSKGKRESKPPRPMNTAPTSLIANKSTKRTSQNSLNCIICSGSHTLVNCEKFNNSSVDERWALLKGWNGCRNCLNSAHSVQTCSSKWHCRFCTKRHHSLLHNSTEVRNNPLPNQNLGLTTSAANASLSSTVAEVAQVILGTAVVEMLDGSGRYQKVRVVIDSGSQNSFLTQRCLSRLGLSMERMKKRISGIGQTPFEGTKGMTTCVIRPLNARSTQLSTDAIVVTNITSFLPSTLLPLTFIKKCSSYKLADPCFWKPAQVDFLLGADLFPQILQGPAIPIEGSQSCLIPTVFGHIVLGRISECSPSLQATSLLTFDAADDLNLQLKKFWEIEEPIASVTAQNPDDEKCELHFQSTHYRLPTGRYVVRLPFKDDEAQVGDSTQIALRRFHNLEKKLNSNPAIKSAYQEFMKEYQDLNHMSPASTFSKFFIPHHCVVKEDKQCKRLRVVFDASVKVSGGSLNEHLLTGPKLQNDIREVLLRFRRHPVVFTTDIVKMFRMIEVHKEDRQYQHIYWRSDPKEPVQTFELHTVTYGLAPAPFLAQRVLKQLTLDHGDEHPLAADLLLKDIYVDDILAGAGSIADAISLYRELVNLLKKGEFCLSKWNSNSSELLNTISPDTLSDPVDMSPSEDHCVKILGLQWDPHTDSFSFQINQPTPTFTKRGILSLVARLYDPMGFLTPTILLLKSFIQELWKLSLDWDQTIPQGLADSWAEVISELPQLSKVNVPRYLHTLDNTVYQIVGFSDASTKGYAAVLYFRISTPNGWHISLLTSKSKLAPTKTISVPRLELCGAYLLAQLYKSIQSFLSSLRQSMQDPVFFTDSSIVLSWLLTPSYKLKTFVANRVTKIHELIHEPATWKHVVSEENPCDVASRGTPPSQLLDHHLWWSGPPWLKLNQEEWPISIFKPPDSVPEVKEETFPALAIRTTATPLILWIERFSSFSTLVKATGWLTRWLYNLKHVSCCCCPIRTGHLKSPEYHLGLEMCIKAVQSHHFSLEKMHHKYANLKPFLDSKGIWRVGGRLRHSSVPEGQKYPILLPHDSHFTTILVDHYHTIYMHPGPTTLQAVIQTLYWVPSLRRLIRQRGFHCLKCYKSKANVITPMMGDLPSFRVNGGRTFQHVGIDFAGPFPLKESSRRNASTGKVYLCLYVCMTTKALHLEAVTRLTTEAFLASLQRFTSRRGIPSDVYSDCGSNFLGAANYLKELYLWFKSQDTTKDLLNYALKTDITWHFNPPQTPHMGGIWEAGVRSVKRYLRLIGGNTPLTYEEIATWFAKIEAILNSRPLCPLSTSPEETNYLSPGHFLVGGPLVVAPEPSVLDIRENRLSKWQLVSRMSEEFWRRWSSEYLSTLQRRPKWKEQQKNLEVGDLVLLKESSLPLHWKLGKVIQVHPGKDNVVRVATIRSGQSTYKRSAVNLVPLPHLTSSAYPMQS